MTCTTQSVPDQPSDAAGLERNQDLRPTTRAQRTLTAWEMASLWVGLVVGVPSYCIAGTLVEKGMSWWQGLAIVVSAKAILLGPLLLASHPGTCYGIPFPVLARAAFGVRGAHVPALLRALVARGWFGIETWIGGQAVFLLLPSFFRTTSAWTRPVPWLGTSSLELACFAFFWLAQMAVVWKGMRGIRAVEKYSAPVLVLLSALLLGWVYVRAGGLGPILCLPARLSSSQFWALFFPSLTACVGSWGAVALSIPDFTRYARSQADQVVGQLGVPLFTGAFSFVGFTVTSATQLIFGRVISNPIGLLAEIAATDGALPALIAMPGITLAILTTNIPANVVAPANALVALAPGRFTFSHGALLTALVGVAFQPWRIFGSSDSFVYTWVVGYSAVVGPVAGIILTDYYVLRLTILDVKELYCPSPEGAYYYTGGYNMVALASLVVSLAPTVPGFLHEVGIVRYVSRAFIFIYDIAWFFGFFLGALVYGLLSYCCSTTWGDLRKNKRKYSTDAAARSPCSTSPLLLTWESIEA